MQNKITISFPDEKALDNVSIRSVRGLVGLYFIYLLDVRIPYPFRPSRLIYIGMSESPQNSIGNRLRDHKSGQSGNFALMNYTSTKDVRFTYHTLDFLNVTGCSNTVSLEAFFLRAFLKRHGSYPICNNQSGIDSSAGPTLQEVEIDWKHFE